MSERHANDFYATPVGAIEPVITELAQYMQEPRPRVLDPGCGQGALSIAALQRWPRARIIAVEKFDAPRTLGGHLVVRDDFLTMHPYPAADLILCNPPFSLAQEFIDRMFMWADSKTIVAVLQRVNFMGAQKRHAWWKAMPRKPKLRILSTRPSFTEGGTDSTEYAWYLWGLPNGAPALDWYK